MSDPKHAVPPSTETTAPLADFLRRLAAEMRCISRRDAGDWPDQLRDDQGRRWSAGERVRVEDYLRHLPALGQHTDALLDLIYNEVLLREALGERPLLDELQARFPHHRAALGRQWEVHRVIEAEALQLDDLEDGGMPGFSSFDLVLPSEPDQDALIETTGGDARANSAPREHGKSSQEPTISGYDVLEELGRGGNGVVYLARQRSLNRLVAIKMIAPDRTLTTSQVARIRTEAELIARLQHPHIVAIHRVGLCDNQPYLVLEYVFGGSLADRMDGPWPASAAMTLIETLAQTLAVVHEQGIIHRDLKPANILLQTASENNSTKSISPVQKTGSGSNAVPLAAFAIPKIVDFGLAKTLAEAEPSAVRAVTRTGELLGTPAYMAPEQVSCKTDRIGPATDLHALGVILHELLTGKSPFEANNAFDMLTQIAFTVPVPPSRLVKGVSADLDAVVLRCLAKEPEARYGSALELAEDLHRVRHGFPSRSRAVGLMERLWLWSCRQPAVATLFVVVLLTLVGGLGAVGVQWQRAEAALALATQAQDDLETALADSKLAWQGAATDRDKAEAAGKRAAADRDKANAARKRLTREQDDLKDTLNKLDEAKAELQVRLTRSLVSLAEAERLRHNFAQANKHLTACPVEAREWEWHYLAGLCRMRLATLGGLREVAGSVAISPDGRWLASVATHRSLAGSLCLWDTSTGKVGAWGGEPPTKRAPVALEHPSRTLVGRGSVAFRPGGKWLATVNPEGGVLLYPMSSIEASAPRALPAVGTMRYRKVLWSPDGRYLAAKRDNTVHLWSFDQEGKPTTPDPLVVPRAWLGDNGSLRAIAFRPDSKVLALAATERVCFYDLADKKIRRPAARQGGKGGKKAGQGVPPVQIEHGGKSTLSALAWAGNNRLVTGASDGILRIYEMPGRALAFALEGHTMTVDGLCSAGKERSLLASVAADGTARVWDLEQRKEVARMPAHNAIAVDRRGTRLLTASRRREVIVWATRPISPESPQDWHTEPVPALTFSSRGILATGAGRLVQLHDPRTLAGLGRIDTPLAVHSLAFHPGGRLLAIGMGQQAGRLCLHDTQTRQEVVLVNRGTDSGAVLAVAFSRDGRFLASAALDGSVSLWQGSADVVPLRSLPAWKFVWRITEHKNAATGVAFSPDGRTLASTGRDGMLLVRDVSTGRLVRPAQQVRGPQADRKDDKEAVSLDNVCGVAFSPDGKHLVTVGRFGNVVLLNAATGKEERKLVGHTGTVHGIVYSPDGRRLATGGADGTVRLWDPQRGEEVLTLGGHTRSILALGFSVDGRFLATSGKDRLLLHESAKAGER